MVGRMVFLDSGELSVCITAHHHAPSRTITNARPHLAPPRGSSASALRPRPGIGDTLNAWGTGDIRHPSMRITHVRMNIRDYGYVIVLHG